MAYDVMAYPHGRCDNDLAYNVLRPIPKFSCEVPTVNEENDIWCEDVVVNEEIGSSSKTPARL